MKRERVVKEPNGHEADEHCDKSGHSQTEALENIGPVKAEAQVLKASSLTLQEHKQQGQRNGFIDHSQDQPRIGIIERAGVECPEDAAEYGDGERYQQHQAKIGPAMGPACR